MSSGLCGTTEYFGGKSPLRSSNPSTNPALPRSLRNHVPKCHLHTSFEQFLGSPQAGYCAYTPLDSLKPVFTNVSKWKIKISVFELMLIYSQQSYWKIVIMMI